MKKIILTTIMLLTATHLNAQEIKLFDPGVLGQATDEAVKLFVATDPKAVEPQTIQVDLENGKYSGVMVHYGRNVTLEQARESLNEKYKKYQQPSFSENKEMGVWRVIDRKFAIQLAKTEDGVRIIYLPFGKEQLK
ncbi:MAG: hypothetical protein HXX11_04420 [Desulfuromonadales bacterium]|nr:hypothetical protein [Desulfuromonadales bacterium]